MKLHIPTVGDRLKLIHDWYFQLFTEYRNKTYFQYLYPEEKWGYKWEKEATKKLNSGMWDDTKIEVYDVEMPAGAVLVVDRLYLAKNNDDFHSVTFIVRKKDPILNNKKQIRFWAKLEEVNKIQCDFL